MTGVLESHGPNGSARYALGPRAGVIGAIDLVFGERIHPPELRGHVLLKHARREHPSFATLRERLVDEALENASFAHPNLTAVVDMVENESGVFLVLELPLACDLGAINALLRTRDHALSPELAAFIGLELLKGIHHLHTARGPTGERLTIVVRELTPAHVLLSTAGEVKITNRGLAAALTELKKPSPAEQLAYYAPERIAGEPFSARSDVYAVGVMLFELLRGRTCFTGASKDEVLGRIVSSAVPVAELTAVGVPPHLVAVVERASAFVPERRYASAADAIRDLEPWVAANTPRDAHRLLSRFLGLNGLVRVSTGPNTTKSVLAPGGAMPSDDELRVLSSRPEVRSLFGDRAPTPEECAFLLSIVRDGVDERELHALRTRPVPRAHPSAPPPAARPAPQPSAPPAPAQSAPPHVQVVAEESAAEADDPERPLTPAEKKRQRRQWWRETVVIVLIALGMLVLTLMYAAFEAELSRDPEFIDFLDE